MSILCMCSSRRWFRRSGSGTYRGGVESHADVTLVFRGRLFNFAAVAVDGRGRSSSAMRGTRHHSGCVLCVGGGDGVMGRGGGAHRRLLKLRAVFHKSE